jgi:hypothetical protein
MNKRLWVLNPLLLSLTLPAIAAEEENLIVSANRSQRTVAEMAQTTWVIEGSAFRGRVQGVLSRNRCPTNYGMNRRAQTVNLTPLTRLTLRTLKSFRRNLTVWRWQYRWINQHRHQKRPAGA